MKKNWSILVLLVLVVSTLYFIELSKVKSDSSNSIPTLDNLSSDEISENWDAFYKVRANIIDGQSAEFSIPQKIKDKEGKELKLSGGPVYFGNGCRIIDDSTTEVSSFFLLPSLGLAKACELQPDVAMRWTVLVRLANPWRLNRNEMANNEVAVAGEFKINTSKPYEAAFYLENAFAKLK